MLILGRLGFENVSALAWSIGIGIVIGIGNALGTCIGASFVDSCGQSQRMMKSELLELILSTSGAEALKSSLL